LIAKAKSKGISLELNENTKLRYENK